MPTSRMPNPRDYPDPIGYALASADWWRAQVHDVNTARMLFSGAFPPSPASVATVQALPRREGATAVALDRAVWAVASGWSPGDRDG